MKLIIDAGHGGLDTGGYFDGYLEKYLTLVVARRAKQLLKQYNPSMTREDDISIVWNDRAEIIKDKYDYCISIHFNIGGGVGVEAIHSAFTTKGKLLASELVNAISETSGIPKRPIPIFSKKNSAGQDYYYMHRLTGTTTTVIVECLFMDAPNEVDIDKLNLEKIAEGIAKGFMNFAGIPVIEQPISNPYKLIRKYNSNIHIYEVDKTKKLDFDLGVRFRLEKVSDVIKPKLSAGEKILCGINGGFFNFDGSSEHLGMYIDDGLYYSQPSINFVDFIYYKDGRTEIKNLHGYDRLQLSKLQAETNWSVGTSYALVIDGKINLMLADKFSHSKNKEPRTMIGQKADGNFILAVADGRSTASSGLTAQEQAQVMLELGCVNAVNLDGGGSSTMCLVENGIVKVVNKPSDGSERKVGSVLLVKGV